MIKVRWGESNWLKTPQPNLPLWHLRELKICGQSSKQSRFQSSRAGVINLCTPSFENSFSDVLRYSCPKRKSWKLLQLPLKMLHLPEISANSALAFRRSSAQEVSNQRELKPHCKNVALPSPNLKFQRRIVSGVFQGLPLCLSLHSEGRGRPVGGRGGTVVFRSELKQHPLNYIMELL